MTATRAPAGDRPSPRVAEPDATRDAIVEAALACFLRAGVDRTSVQEIAAEAGVSRGTVYNHFADREAVVEAAVERTVEWFLAAATTGMDARETLDGRLAELAVLARAAATGGGRPAGFTVPEDLMARLLTSRAAPLLRRSTAFVAGYLERARDAGEVRADLDLDAAAEWVVRAITSIATTPPVVVVADDPTALGDFVSAHVVRGLR